MNTQEDLDFTPRVVARTTDPETSHEAARAFDNELGKVSRSIRAAVQILTEHGELSDFDIRGLWPAYWDGPWSDSLPCKARHWARQAGLVRHVGFKKHNGRNVRTWALGSEEEE